MTEKSFQNSTKNEKRPLENSTKVESSVSKSRKYLGSPLDYTQLGRKANALHKKWNHVVSNGLDFQDETSGDQNLKKLNVMDTDYYREIMDSDRIKAIIDQKLEQAMFEKVI